MYLKYYPSAPFFTMRETHTLKIKNCRDNPKNPFSEGFMADGLGCYRFSHCLKSGTRSVLTNASSPSARGGWSTTLIRLPE